MTDRNPKHWLWAVVPPLAVVLAAPLGIAVLGAVGYAIHLTVDGLRRRDEPREETGLELHVPFRSGCARVGRLFAFGCVAAAIGPDRITQSIGAAVFAVLGSRLLIRLIRRTPVVRLTGEGVEVRGRRYRWEEIRGVELNGDRWQPRLDLFVGQRRPVVVRQCDVDGSLPVFAARAAHALAS